MSELMYTTHLFALQKQIKAIYILRLEISFPVKAMKRLSWLETKL